MLRPFEASEAAAASAEEKEAERRLEDARRSLCKAHLALRCERVPAEGGETGGWRVWLTCAKPLPLPNLAMVYVWPITRGEGHRREVLAALASGESVDLGVTQLADLTRFTAFQLADVSSDKRLLFSLGLPMEGLPAERQAAIFRAIITNRDAFFRYLRLLLSELGDPFAAALAAQSGSAGGSWGHGGGDDVPLLEDMVRALSSGDGRLAAVERLISRLSAEDGDVDTVPADFLILWEAFRAVMKQDTADVG